MYLSKKETFKSSMKITSNNAMYEIREKTEIFEKKEKDIYIQSVVNYYHQKINYIERSKNKSKQKQIKNLKKELQYFQSIPDFQKQDIFKKHKDFVFTKSNEPMSRETIKNVRNEIKKTLGIKIPYDCPLFQLLKRGIGIYVENQPEEYKWILQKLLSRKEIGIVISDKTLCMGIDLPVRTSCFLGINNEFSKEEYLQMSGRAGRRGLDNQGNIIFYGNIDYISLMKSELPDIKGSVNPIHDNYKLLLNNKVYENMINPDRIHISTNNFIVPSEKKCYWGLRDHYKSYDFVNNIFHLEKELYDLDTSDREIHMFKKLIDLLNISETMIDEYKTKKIKRNHSLVDFKNILSITIKIHNSLNYKKYILIREKLVIIFDVINKMIFNFII
tara:strand:- start:1729 stop:2889 length:1161 start_codon:yes stop_codon:yes gene_type:complete